MTTTSSVATAPQPSGRERLIQEGAASYVKAIIALKEFKRIVQDGCEQLALKHLNDINRIMGVKVSEDDLHHFPRTGSLSDPQDPWLCMYFTLKDVAYLNVGLYWQSLSDAGYQLHAIAALHILDEKLYQKAREKFEGLIKTRDLSFPYRKQARFITLSEPIGTEEVALFPKSVDSVLTGFLEEWEQIGGLEGLKEAQSKPKS
jgi:hypothetical protein